jgi:hypothetical protein
VQDDEFVFYKEGVLSGVRADETASDGACAWLSSASPEWAVQYHISSRDFKKNKRYRLYAVIKVQKQTNSGNAFSYGVYDTDLHKDVASRRVLAKDAATDWKVYEIAAFQPKEKEYVWFAGCGNTDAVVEILIDRIYFVEEEEESGVVHINLEETNLTSPAQ